MSPRADRAAPPRPRTPAGGSPVSPRPRSARAARRSWRAWTKSCMTPASPPPWPAPPESTGRSVSTARCGGRAPRARCAPRCQTASPACRRCAACGLRPASALHRQAGTQAVGVLQQDHLVVDDVVVGAIDAPAVRPGLQSAQQRLRAVVERHRIARPVAGLRSM